MKLLSDDDLDLASMTPEELDRAWDLWFELAQETNDHDPPYTHGVFVGLDHEKLRDLAVRGSDRAAYRAGTEAGGAGTNPEP
ncbi:MAG: hypothetical protein JNK60_07945 [Acidobacteria bacterium]|nr:hypothetical protein [Acidobacteriota bacterium]